MDGFSNLQNQIKNDKRPDDSKKPPSGLEIGENMRYNHVKTVFLYIQGAFTAN